MTDFTKLTDDQLQEALAFHRRQRNMTRDINESANMRATQTVRMLEAEEARRLAEAKVESNHTFQPGDTVHMSHYSTDGGKYLGTSKVEKATSNEVHVRHPKGGSTIFRFKQGAAGLGGMEIGGKHMTKAGGLVISKDKVHPSFKGVKLTESADLNESTDHSAERSYHIAQASRATNKLAKEEFEQIDEISKDTLHSYWKKAATARYPLDVKARQAETQKTNRIRSGKSLAGYKPKDELTPDEKRVHANRKKGMDRAGNKLFRSEEVELDEQIKGWKHAASDISNMRSAQGKSVKLVSLKKDGNESKMHDAAKVFRSEEEAQQHHDRVTKLNPKSKIRHNMYVDGKHVKTLGEEVEQMDELSKSTLGSYATKALRRGDIAARMSHSDSDAMGKIAAKRLSGVKSAVDKLASKKADATRIKTNVDKAKEAGRNRGTDKDDQGKAYYAAEKGIAKLREEVDVNESDNVQSLAIQAIQSKLKKAKVSYRDPNAKTAREEDRIAKQLAAKAKLNKEEIEINEASDLRITKVYNKWPKKATYAVHTPDRKYFKEFDSMEAAKAHHAEKSDK